MENLVKVLKEFKENGKIKDYGFEEYRYWQGIPVIYLNNGGHIFLAKIWCRDGATNIYTLDKLETEKEIKDKLEKILIEEETVLDCCCGDISILESALGYKI